MKRLAVAVLRTGGGGRGDRARAASTTCSAEHLDHRAGRRAAARNCISGVLSGSSIAKRTVHCALVRLGHCTPPCRVGRLGRRDLRRAPRSAWSPAPRSSGPRSWRRASRSPVSASCSRPAAARALPAAASVDLDFKALDTSVKPAEALARQGVHALPRRGRAELDKLGLDLTEHGGRNFVDVVLHGARRRRDACAGTTSPTRTEIADLAAETGAPAEPRLSGARSAQAAAALPSGRTGSYRRLRRLPERDEAAGGAEPEAGEADHAAVQDLDGHVGAGHRDHRGRERARRQAGVPEHGRPPRPRVALRRDARWSGRTSW